MRFADWLERGYDTLISVSPPSANIADAGKRPARRNADGNWYSPKKWNDYRVDPSDLPAWEKWGANLGLVNKGQFFILDIDSYNEKRAASIEATAKAVFGDAPRRVGQWPKRALLYRTDEPIEGIVMPYKEGEETHRVETTAINGQIVIQGVHPKSGNPYEWDREIPRYEDLPLVTRDKVENFFTRLQNNLPEARRQSQSLDTGPGRDPEALKGDHDLVRDALARIPNDDTVEYPEYITMGQAVRGAFGPGFEDEAYEAWDAWSRKSPKYDEALNEKHWRTMGQSRTVGAQFLFGRATKHGWDREHEVFFGKPEAPTEPRPEQRLVIFKPVSFFAGRPTPPRDWVVPSIVPCKTVTLLSGDGGTGKSLLALQLAASVALGLDWLGNPCKQGPVVVLSAEDDEDELQRRFEDVFRSLGADLASTHNLRFISLAGEDAVLGALQGERIVPTPLFKRVEEEIADTKPVLSVFDTLADLYGGNEINRTQTRQFVGLLRGLSVRHDTAGLLLSHPSVAGMQSGSGTSGSTAWNNSVRSRLYFERIQEGGREPNPDLRRLTTKKSNYGPVGAQIGLRYSRGVFVVDESAAATSTGEGAAKVQAAFLDALEQFNLRGQPVSSKKGANYAPRLFAEMSGAAFVMTKYQDAMTQLLEAKAIKVVMEGRTGRERARLVACTPEERGFPPDMPDVFE